ncbi:hypothetical protein GALMADRAFT_234372 [Galerina marginata CBS 339.88]|uniref:Uncharacterized protein n=1 Tax=Galerina marginata (strain CBS 339.88) TaxID=685588 RepID=A0A067TZQ4_GALM3|nr:hypothetical protein GALMADRAFT_234372 [Galerina marginata CBS 339.88]
MSSLALVECVDYADTNPDIAGVGVRISFYLQAFLLVLLVDRSWEDAPLALWTFIVTSFGITLAAIIQREQLSFFQALQLSNLIWLANFGIFVALATYSRHKAEAIARVQENGQIASDFKVKYGAMFQTLFSMSLTLYMWAKAPTFGNQPECSPFVKFVLFAFKVQALGAGRYIGLILSSLLMLLYIWISVHDMRSTHRQNPNPQLLRGIPENDKKKTTLRPSPLSPLSSMTLPNGGPNLQLTQAPSTASNRWPTGLHSQESPTLQARLHSALRRPKRRRWSLDVDPMFVGIVICQVLVFTYFVISSELLLLHNPSTNNDANQWGFGQILALIVITPSALSVIDAMSRHGFRRLSKRKRRSLDTRVARELNDEEV